MKSTTFALLPRDGLFLKDGRGWYTSDVGRSHGHDWPLPPTIRGALRHAYGHALMERTGEPALLPAAWEQQTAELAIRKLVAFRREPGPALDAHARLWPCPADAWYDEHGAVTRLQPETRSIPGLTGLGDRQDPARAGLWRPHLRARKPGTPPMFWAEELMVRWLRGDEVGEAEGLRPPQRTDMHVTITAETQAATQSMLFSSEVTEPLDRRETRWGEWGLAVECALPAAEIAFPPRMLTLGGRRRLARVAETSRDFFAAPGDLGGDSSGLRLILVTPAEFQEGWLPDGFEARGSEYRGRLPEIDEDVILRAALVPPPLDLSTWDMRRNAPRPTWRLVRPGAVYYFHKASGTRFLGAELQRLWLAQLGGRREEGFGLVLPGRWEHK
jgi:CRISPR-associated protein Cmr3